MIELNTNWHHGLGKFCIGLAFIGSLQGCEHIASMARSKEGKALICGGGALVTGAATGFGCYYLLGSKAGCSVLGAAAALADGYLCWWKLSDKIVEDYEQTAETLHYDASQGYVVKILDFSAEPKIVRPGDTVNIRVKYALMSPNPTDEIKYERIITLPSENKPRTQIVTHQPGTWGTEGDYSFPIDATAPEGKVEMTLEVKLSSYGKQDRRTLCFNVTRQSQPNSNQLCSADVKSGVKQGSVFMVSNVKQHANVCREPDKRCKSSKSKKFLDIVRLSERFLVLDKAMHDSILWYKIQLKDGRTGWIRATTGTLVEK